MPLASLLVTRHTHTYMASKTGFFFLLFILLITLSSSSSCLARLLLRNNDIGNFFYSSNNNNNNNLMNYPAVFNFGDSNSDTGGFFASLSNHLGPPYGNAYFNKTTGRISDGRLIIDFLMDAMGLPFLNPYLKAIGAPSFRNGCNFAVAGCTILAATASSSCPFSFRIQVSQFLRFKSDVLQLLSETKELDKYIPLEDYFPKGLYMFDIGQNDLDIDFHSMSLPQVDALIQTILAEFEAGIKELYDNGARNFWVHNTGPLGCLAHTIVRYETDPSKLDELGCVSFYNQASRLFNWHLRGLCRKFQSQFSDANLIYHDIFTIKMDLIANYSLYGFKHAKMACCGFGGPPLNYDTRMNCGKTMVLNGRVVTAEACNDSNEYVIWDGSHLTEAANQHVSSQILTGKYSHPPFTDKATFPSQA